MADTIPAWVRKAWPRPWYVVQHRAEAIEYFGPGGELLRLNGIAAIERPPRNG